MCSSGSLFCCLPAAHLGSNVSSSVFLARVQQQPPALWWEGCPLVRACQEDPCHPAFSRSVQIPVWNTFLTILEPKLLKLLLAFLKKNFFFCYVGRFAFVLLLSLVLLTERNSHQGSLCTHAACAVNRQAWPGHFLLMEKSKGAAPSVNQYLMKRNSWQAVVSNCGWRRWHKLTTVLLLHVYSLLFYLYQKVWLVMWIF